jgi:uncharacterized membrane protein YfcA
MGRWEGRHTLVGGLEALGLAVAAFAAGAVNAVAGGGSLISFPALIAAGYPAKTANVTSTVALWPGSVGGSIAYREELSTQKERIKVLGAIAILGAIVGSILLLVSPPGVFKAIVPWLIFFACFLLLLQPRISAWVRAHRPRSADVKHPVELLVGEFIAATYGAYFGAGLGIVTLAILGIFLPDDLQKLNALKGLLALIINGIAMIIFAVFGPVVWSAALLMAACSWAGGYLGVRIARKFDPRVLRAIVLIAGFAAAIKLLVA